MEKNKIFVCYRREDAAWTRSIYEKLEREFGENSVFMDVEAIAAGRNFEEVILASLRECFAAVVVIGPTWLDPAEGEEDSRLHDVNDYVHLEIFTCLAAGIRIIPVLVSGAKMPKPDLLPRNLRTLTKINARTIPTDDLFDHATSLLAGSLREAHAETRPQETVVVTPEVPPDRSRRWRTASLVLAAALMVVTGASGYYALTQTNQTGNTVLRYRQEINQLTAKLEVSEATAAQLKREIETLAAQRDGAQPQITELRTALTEKEKEIDRLGTEIAKLRQQNEKLEDDVKTFQARFDRQNASPSKKTIFSNRRDVHVGDRDESGLTTWPPSVGPCYRMPNDYSGYADRLSVTYEAYGLETANIRVGDTDFEFHRQERENDWTGPYEKVIDVKTDMEPGQVFAICANLVPDWDFDNFRIRNVSVTVLN